MSEARGGPGSYVAMCELDGPGGVAWLAGPRIARGGLGVAPAVGCFGPGGPGGGLVANLVAN